MNKQGYQQNYPPQEGYVEETPRQGVNPKLLYIIGGVVFAVILIILVTWSYTKSHISKSINCTAASGTGYKCYTLKYPF